MKKLLLIIIAVLMLVQPCLAAIISGTVYDWDLTPVENAIIEVDTTPRQTIVSPSGDYILTLSQGAYEIKARSLEGSHATETIEVVLNGTYTLDIILFPDLDDPYELFNGSDLDMDENLFEEKKSPYPFIIAGVALVGLILMIFFIVKIRGKEREIKKEVKVLKEELKHKEIDMELKKIVAAIKQAGGRTTQKDLRKQFPSSEAKISLMITELERKGIIEKIKKGRGNVIVLK
jgi:uncharacterized membrane protein